MTEMIQQDCIQLSIYLKKQTNYKLDMCGFNLHKSTES